MAATPAGVFTMHKLYPALISAVETGDQNPDVRIAKEVLEKLESEVQFTGLFLVTPLLTTFSGLLIPEL